MAKLLTVILLTLLSFTSIGAAPFEVAYSNQMAGAENFAFIDPMVDEKQQHAGFIYSDQAERRLIIDDFSADSLLTIGLSGAPVKTIHYLDSDSDTLYIYCLISQFNQMPKIAYIKVNEDGVDMTVYPTNCNVGYGTLDKVVYQDIRFDRMDVDGDNGNMGVLFEASLSYEEDMPGFGSSSETYATTILYSLDLADELFRSDLSSLRSGNFYGDEKNELFGYINYEYGYDFRQSGDPAAYGEMRLTTVVVQDSLDLRLTEVTTPQGITKGALTGNFDQSDEFDEIIVSGVSDDLEGILSGLTPQIVCYSFAGENATRLWDLDDSLIDLQHVYHDMGLIAGTIDNQHVIFIDFEDGEIVDSLDLGRKFDAFTFFETYSNPSTLDVVGRTADSIFVYRFDIMIRRQASVSDEPEPQTFTLLQNYPNPFNAETRLSFENEASQYLTLKIYNILGQEVATLAEGAFSPGTYYAYWNGADVNGIMQSTGVYFAKLQADNSSQIIKLIFLK